jgi:hypothetical protein
MGRLDKYIKMVPGKKSVRASVDLHKLTKAFQNGGSGSLREDKTKLSDTVIAKGKSAKSGRAGDHQPPGNPGGSN